MKKIYVIVVLITSSLFVNLNEIKAIDEVANQKINELQSLNQRYQTDKSLLTEIIQKDSEIKELINQKQSDIIRQNNEIEKIKSETKENEKRIEDILKNKQNSNNNNYILQFVFSSTSFEELVDRISYTRQIQAYNQDIINKQKVVIQNLNLKNEELQKEIAELNAIARDSQKIVNEALVQEAIAKKIITSPTEITKCSENTSIQECVDEFSEIQAAVTQNEANLSTEINALLLNNNSKFHPPVLGASVSQEYGPSSLYSSGLHQGLDYTAGSGTAIHAVQDGVIVYAGYAGDFGNNIIIKHTNSLYTRYAHMSGLNASVGQSVTSGSVIGFMGSTGYSTGTHLHFETMVGGNSYSNRVNPRTVYPQLP